MFGVVLAVAHLRARERHGGARGLGHRHHAVVPARPVRAERPGAAANRLARLVHAGDAPETSERLVLGQTAPARGRTEPVEARAAPRDGAIAAAGDPVHA